MPATKNSMIDTLITSKTRIKLLLRFFLNKNTSSYLRELATDFKESTNSIRIELNRLEKSGFLVSHYLKNKKMYKANEQHPLYIEVHNILLKYIGLDFIIEKVISKVNRLEKVYLIGNLAKGFDSMVVDLLLIGQQIDKENLMRLIDKAENSIKRKIRFMVMQHNEASLFIRHEIGEKQSLLLWESA